MTRGSHDSNRPTHRRAAHGGVVLLLLLVWLTAAGRWIAAQRVAGVPGTPLRLNPNTAPAEALALLPGIGPVRARAIVEFRQQHAGGPFRSGDDLQQVRGIGPKTAGRIAPLLCFDVQDAPSTENGSEP